MPEGSVSSTPKPSSEKPWLWRWGMDCWLGLGIIGAIAVFGWVYAKAHGIIIPLVVAVIIGILLKPVVALMTRHHIPRWLATALTMIIIIAVIGGFIAVVAYGITTQAGAIGNQVGEGVNRIKAWLENLNVSQSTADWIHEQIEKAWPAITDGLTREVTRTVPGIASFMIGLFISFFILLFILGDDGALEEWVAGHMGVPRETGDIVLKEVFTSFRGYFKGTTIIATVDALLIVPVALILKVPLVPAIALVTFVTCFIPSFGGYIGGAFAVFITLASRGLGPGLIMLAYTVAVHTVLQAPVQAIAYGRTLQLHPLLALLMTLIGAVFGGIFGAIVAVPLTAVVLKVSRELKRVRAEEGIDADGTCSPQVEVKPVGEEN